MFASGKRKAPNRNKTRRKNNVRNTFFEPKQHEIKHHWKKISKKTTVSQQFENDKI